MNNSITTMKTSAKIIIAAAVLSLPSLPAIAQEQEVAAPTTAPAKVPKFALSINAGATFSYTDVNKSKVAPIIGVGGHYYATPYLHLNLDVQKGWLQAGESDNTGMMHFKNSFISAGITARFLPIALVSNKDNNEALSFLSNIYGGVGLGFISNSVDAKIITSAEYGSLGKYNTTALYVPLEVGLNIPVVQLTNNRRLLLNFNYRANLCFTDKLDGYVPTVQANEKNDAYNALTVGMVYNF